VRTAPHGAATVQFNVSQLLREPIGSRRVYQAEEPFRPEPASPHEVVLRGPVELLRIDRGILARAQLTSQGASECARCLRPVRIPVELAIEEEFVPSVDPVTGAALPATDEPGVFTVDAHHILDLTEPARQAWQLAQPMAPLCREDCPGLCPQCGADRASGGCTCTADPVDARWAALAGLRQRNGAAGETAEEE